MEKNKLSINLITSKIFWDSIPLVIKEIGNREHFLYIYDQDSLPSIEILLNCDVLMDLSAIIDIKFYQRINNEINMRNLKKIKMPLFIDMPLAVINSMDKRRTHDLMPDLIPESYNLDGKNNLELINKFPKDKMVIVKDPFGWQAKGIEKVTFEKLLEKFSEKKNLIIQEYIPWKDGIGRVLTLNYEDNFEIMCAYLRVPNSWRTGYDTDCEYKQIVIDEKLKNFSRDVAVRSGLYLNGIDFIFSNNRYYLLEVNAAPGIRDPFDEFGINTPSIFLDHVESVFNRYFC